MEMYGRGTIWLINYRGTQTSPFGIYESSISGNIMLKLIVNVNMC